MTVKELIEKLEALNQETKVVHHDSYYGTCDVTDVYQSSERDGTLIMVIDSRY